MKDQLIAIVEALRLSQVLLETHFEVGGQLSAETTLKELRRVLLERHVLSAMESLFPNVESPATSPDDAHPSECQSTKLIIDAGLDRNH